MARDEYDHLRESADASRKDTGSNMKWVVIDKDNGGVDCTENEMHGLLQKAFSPRGV